MNGLLFIQIVVVPIRYLQTALLLVLLISCKDKKVKVWISFFPAHGKRFKTIKNETCERWSKNTASASLYQLRMLQKTFYY